MDASSPQDLRWSFSPRLPYQEAEDLQARLREDLRRQRGPESLLLLAHPPVYTLGRNARREDILLPDSALRSQGIEVHQCNRGGQVTYHGPGQLVGYPILNLSPDRRDIRRYVRDLQETLLRTLSDVGVEAQLRDGQEYIGVWVGKAKIASIGVHLSRWITSHGFALNVTTDLSLFKGIVACGLSGVSMTSIEAETGKALDLREVATLCAGHFSEVFGRRLVSQPQLGGSSPEATGP